MRARQILSKNVRTLLDAAKESSSGPATIRKVTEMSHGKLTNGTVGRIVAGSHPTDIDKLADLAEVFGVQPWQLLVENLNPKALPRLADSGLLSQIKQLVDSVPATKQEDFASATDEQPLQTPEQGRRIKVGPAMEEAIGQTGVDKNARSRTAASPKPKGSRRR